MESSEQLDFLDLAMLSPMPLGGDLNFDAFDEADLDFDVDLALDSSPDSGMTYASSDSASQNSSGHSQASVAEVVVKATVTAPGVPLPTPPKQNSPGYGIPVPIAPRTLPVLLPKSALPPYGLKRPSSSDSDGSDSACAPGNKKSFIDEKEKQRIRAEKNRQAAANSRLKQKRLLADLTAQVEQLQADVAERDQTIHRITMENNSLRDQLSFIRSIFMEKMGDLPVFKPATAPPTPSFGSRKPTPLAQGAVLLVVCLVVSVCLSGPSVGVVGVDSSAAGGRALLQQGQAGVIASVVSVESPPVPSLLWSPVALFTMALYATGANQSVQVFLTHAAAVCVAAAALYLARRTVSSSNSNSIRDTRVPVLPQPA